MWRATGLFHGAEMEDEMILGYPWLCQHRLAVVPSDHALGVGSTDRLIVSWEEGDSDNGFAIWTPVRRIRMDLIAEYRTTICLHDTRPQPLNQYLPFTPPSGTLTYQHCT